MLYLIHQGGKVASQTFEGTIANADRAAFIERHHFMYPPNLDALTRIAAGNDVHAQQQQKQTALARAALEVMKRERGSIWVVTGFRDPLDHAISRFFQNLDEFCPSYSSPSPGESYDRDRFDVEVDRVIGIFNEQVDGFLRNHEGDASIAALLERFWSARYAIHMAKWFDFEFKPLHGLDIYDVDVGSNAFVTTSHDGSNFLFYRMEGVHKVLPSILEALPLPRPIPVVSRNVGEEKDYGVLYRRFRQRFAPTAQMVSYYYDTRFFRHLYPGVKPLYETGTIGMTTSV
ncbi:MAG: putative capsular polysaccharide synthesis family protein [Vulcanimicrobiaceae bacterium]|jgi:hypothetical protein